MEPRCLRPFTPIGIEWKKDGFGAEAEAWVGGAGRQTSAPADKHGSVSEGEGVGGDEGRERGGGGVKQEMRHWGVLPNPAAVRDDMAGPKLRQVSPLSNVTQLLSVNFPFIRLFHEGFSLTTFYCFYTHVYLFMTPKFNICYLHTGCGQNNVGGLGTMVRRPDPYASYVMINSLLVTSNPRATAPCKHHLIRYP